MGILAWLWTLVGHPPTMRERHEKKTEQAKRRAERIGVIYDPYPDDRTKPRVTVWLRGKVGSKSIIEVVDLDGYSLRELNLKRGSWRRDWVAGRIDEAHKRLKPRLEVMEAERRDRLAKRRGEAE